MDKCYCGSGISFNQCCQPIIEGTQRALTAEALMRSRYSAYVIHNVDYLIATTYPSERANYSKEEITFWATQNQWHRLEIISVTPTTVRFKAYFIDAENQSQIHNEHSRFVFENEVWLYVDGDYFDN
jgi:SEC-C motif-containing protein